MIHLLCAANDHEALWLATALAERGEEVECVFPEELMIGVSLTYRISSASVESSMRLHDGRVLDGAVPSLIINRLTELPTLSTNTSPYDAFYVAEEWRAVVAAWLRTLPCPVLNPPSAGALGGPTLSTPLWRAVGRAHGLQIREWHDEQAESAKGKLFEVLSVAGQCIDPSGLAPAHVPRSLAAVAAYVGAPLIGATFDHSGDRWELTDLTVRPRLTFGGSPLVEAIVACKPGTEATT